MSTGTRRVVIGCALLLATTAAHTQAQPADRIGTGGPVLTMNDAGTRAEAVAVRHGRIVAVGTTADVMKLRGANTTVVDLGGRAMVPGFVDAHGHIFLGGLQALSANLLAPPDGKVTDIASLQRRHRAGARHARDDGRPPGGAYPRTVRPRGPDRRLQAPAGHSVVLPHAHLLLGRLAS